MYNKGIIPKSKNIKLMFLESKLTQKTTNPWMRLRRSKDGKKPSIDSDQRHNQDDIEYNGYRVANAVDYEIKYEYNGDSSRVFLGGKS